MRTTLDLDDQLLRAAKRRAADQGTTLTAVVEDALAALLAPRPTPKRRFKLVWKTRKGRLVPGADIADRDALYDLMDGRR